MKSLKSEDFYYIYVSDFLRISVSSAIVAHLILHFVRALLDQGHFWVAILAAEFAV